MDENLIENYDSTSISSCFSGLKPHKNGSRAQSRLFENGSSIKETNQKAIFNSTKNSLQTKIETAIKVRNALSNREKELQTQIDTLNERAQISLQVLDDRKSQLIEENDELRFQYESYHDIDFLSSQLRILKAILKQNKPKKRLTSFSLKKIGILANDESIDFLEDKLKDYVDQFIRFHNPGPPQPYMNDDSIEEREIRKKIQLLNVTSKAAAEMTICQIEQAKLEVKRLKADLDFFYKKTEKGKKFNPDKEVKKVLKDVGGDEKVLRKVDDGYEYENHIFSVYKKYGKIWGICDTAEFPLEQLLKIFVIFSHT